MTIPFSGRTTISTTPFSLTNSAAPTTIAAQTTSGIFQLVLGLKNMVGPTAGNTATLTDSYRLQVWEKVLSDSTQYVAHTQYFNGAQLTPNVVIPGLYLCTGWDFVLTRIGGADKIIEWSIRQVAVT